MRATLIATAHCARGPTPARCGSIARSLAAAAGAFGAAVLSAQAPQPRPLALDDFSAIKSVGDVELSPDGRTAVYVVREIDEEQDRRTSALWRVEVGGGAPERLTRGESDSSPRFSPDGRHLGFTRSRGEEKSQVWVLPFAGGEAFALTDLKEGVGSFAWAPDGKRLVVTSRDGKAGDPDEKPKKDAPPAPIVVTRLQHKRDGTGYLDLRRNHLYVVSVDEALASSGAKKGPAKQLTDGPFDDGSPEWSPDGRLIVFDSNRTKDPDANNNSDLWTVDPASGKVAQITTDAGADRDPTWSPDGRSIAYIHLPETPPVYATPRLRVIAAAGGTPADLTGRFDRHVGGSARWARDGRSLFVTLVDSGRTPLVNVTLDGQRTVIADGDIGDFEIGPRGAVAVIATPTRPPDVFALAPGGAGLEPGRGPTPRNLSRANETLFASLAIRAPENVHFKSADGTEIEGWVIKPPDFFSARGASPPRAVPRSHARSPFDELRARLSSVEASARPQALPPSRTHPMLLRIHGGPVSQYTDSFSFEHQYLAALGYVVLITNPRGSSGYGEAFSKAIFADWGNKDYTDVMAGVDHVIAQGYVDPKRLGVGGWSYGGILTNYVITKTDRFAAATSGASESDMFSAFGYDDLQRWWITELGAPWDNVELYRRLSPIMEVKKITAATLVLCGEKDFRCPLPQSEQLYLALKTLGKSTALIIYPGQSHAVRRPTYEIDRLRRYGLWYDKFLKGANVDPTYEVFRKKTTSE